MKTLDSVGETLSTDVLVVGGGIAGLGAAIAVKEASPEVDVLVVDKMVSGWGGKANRGAGNIAYLESTDSVEEFVEFHVRNMGCYLEDQDLLRAYAEESRGNLERLERWGVHIYRNADGSPQHVRWYEGLPWRMALMDQDVTLNLAKRCRKLGVKFVDRVAVVDMLLDGERVAGAIGFGMLDGTTHVFTAKGVVIAAGGQNYRLGRLWASGRGDGIAAAYRAGAEMRNAEFGNFSEFMNPDSKGRCTGAEDCLYNARGEHITKAIRPVVEADIASKEIVAWYRETKAGNGPIYANMRENVINNVTLPAFYSDAITVRPLTTAFWKRYEEKTLAAAPKIEGDMVEVVPSFLAEDSCVRVDHEMATNVPGLFAIGDASSGGSSWAGAVPVPPGRMRGSGLGYAVFSAARVGPAVASYVARVNEPRVDVQQTGQIKARMYAPIQRSAGIPPAELVRKTQDVMSPVGYSIFKSEQRLSEALDKVLEIKALLPELVASDWHYLAACNEVTSMVACAEMFYRASLARKESRGWHIREDYPEQNDAEWLRWVILAIKDGEMTTTTQEIPIQGYAYKPDLS